MKPIQKGPATRQDLPAPVKKPPPPPSGARAKSHVTSVQIASAPGDPRALAEKTTKGVPQAPKVVPWTPQQAPSLTEQQQYLMGRRSQQFRQRGSSNVATVSELPRPAAEEASNALPKPEPEAPRAHVPKAPQKAPRSVADQRKFLQRGQEPAVGDALNAAPNAAEPHAPKVVPNAPERAPRSRAEQEAFLRAQRGDGPAAGAARPYNNALEAAKRWDSDEFWRISGTINLDALQPMETVQLFAEFQKVWKRSDSSGQASAAFVNELSKRLVESLESIGPAELATDQARAELSSALGLLAQSWHDDLDHRIQAKGLAPENQDAKNLLEFEKPFLTTLNTGQVVRLFVAHQKIASSLRGDADLFAEMVVHKFQAAYNSIGLNDFEFLVNERPDMPPAAAQIFDTLLASPRPRVLLNHVVGPLFTLISDQSTDIVKITEGVERVKGFLTKLNGAVPSNEDVQVFLADELNKQHKATSVATLCLNPGPMREAWLSGTGAMKILGDAVKTSNDWKGVEDAVFITNTFKDARSITLHFEGLFRLAPGKVDVQKCRSFLKVVQTYSDLSSKKTALYQWQAKSLISELRGLKPENLWRKNAFHHVDVAALNDLDSRQERHHEVLKLLKPLEKEAREFLRDQALKARR